jgi:hypothetical protein
MHSVCNAYTVIYIKQKYLTHYLLSTLITNVQQMHTLTTQSNKHHFSQLRIHDESIPL